MTFGQQLRQLREAKGLMQREVGAWIEVDGAMISKVENGDKRINRDHIPELAKRFKVNEKDLQILWGFDKVMSVLDGEKWKNEILKKIQNEK